jgi:hypothetical protein
MDVPHTLDDAKGRLHPGISSTHPHKQICKQTCKRTKYSFERVNTTKDGTQKDTGMYLMRIDVLTRQIKKIEDPKLKTVASLKLFTYRRLRLLDEEMDC